MTDAKFLASSLFALSLFAVPGVDVPNVGIEGVTLASGAELRLGGCNEVRVFVRAAPTWQGDARIQLVLREAGGDMIYAGTRQVPLSAGAGQTLVFDDVPVRGAGRHTLLASAMAGDATETELGLDVEGACAAWQTAAAPRTPSSSGSLLE